MHSLTEQKIQLQKRQGSKLALTLSTNRSLFYYKNMMTCNSLQWNIPNINKVTLFLKISHKQWCSLCDTQVYGVYPLAKFKNTRYVTTSLWQNFHTFIHKFTPSMLRLKHWLFENHAVSVDDQCYCETLSFKLTGWGHPKNAPLLRVATKAYHLHAFLCLAHLNIQKSL